MINVDNGNVKVSNEPCYLKLKNQIVVPNNTTFVTNGKKGIQRKKGHTWESLK